MTEIDCSDIAIVTSDGKIAEIIINPTRKPVSAAKLVRVMLTNGITAAKIIKSKPAPGDPVINVARNTMKDI